jgi:hypothetical protein
VKSERRIKFLVPLLGGARGGLKILIKDKN